MAEPATQTAAVEPQLRQCTMCGFKAYPWNFVIDGNGACLCRARVACLKRRRQLWPR